MEQTPGLGWVAINRVARRMKNKFYGLFTGLALFTGIYQAAAQNWSEWQSFGSSVNVSVSFAQVPGNTLWTWRFRNDGAVAVTYMDFNYSDDTGQHKDTFPGTLNPGQILGGWAAFTASSNPTITITKIQWANSPGTSGSSSTSSSSSQPDNSQQLQQQQAAQEAQQLIQQQQALLEQQRAAQQARDQQIVNNAYAGAAANNNAGQTMANGILGALQTINQADEEKQQRIADEKAEIASHSQNFADEVTAWRADPDYQQFLQDYQAANGGATFSSDPDQLTEGSADVDVLQNTRKDLDKEQRSFGDWKRAPISIEDSQTYGANLSMDDTVSQINSILSVHLDGSLDKTSVGGTFQINSIDGSGLCISYTAGYGEDQLNHNQGQFRSTTFFAWKDIDASKIQISCYSVGGSGAANRFVYTMSFAPKNGIDFPHKLERTASPYGDDLSQPPSCDYTKYTYRRGSTGLYLDSKVSAEQLVGLVAHAAQLAGGNASGAGISAAPSISVQYTPATGTPTPQTDNLQAQPASATPQPLQPSGASGSMPISPAVEKRVDAMLAQRKQALNLTDDQILRIKPIYEIAIQNSLNLPRGATLSANERVLRRSAIRNNFAQALKDILPPDQYAQWFKFRYSTTTTTDNSQPPPAAAAANPTQGNNDAMAAAFGDPVIVRATGFEIKRSELDQMVSSAKANAAAQGKQPSPDIASQVLNELITLQLLLQKATDADRAAGQAAGDARYNQAIDSSGSQEAFQQKLAAMNMTADQLHSMFTQQLTAAAVLQRIFSDAVTAAGAKDYVAKLKNEYGVEILDPSLKDDSQPPPTPMP